MFESRAGHMVRNSNYIKLTQRPSNHSKKPIQLVFQHSLSFSTRLSQNLLKCLTPSASEVLNGKKFNARMKTTASSPQLKSIPLLEFLSGTIIIMISLEPTKALSSPTGEKQDSEETALISFSQEQK
jgi:hypothetical protein